MTNKKTENRNDRSSTVTKWSCSDMDLQLTNKGKNSINRQNIESVLTLSETGGKLTLIELSIAEKMHCFSRHTFCWQSKTGEREWKWWTWGSVETGHRDGTGATSSPGSSRFPIWRRQERRPWHTAEITWLICPRRVEIYSKWRPR